MGSFVENINKLAIDLPAGGIEEIVNSIGLINQSVNDSAKSSSQALGFRNEAEAFRDEAEAFSISNVFIVYTIEDLVTIPSNYTTAIVKDLDRGGTFIWSATGTANGGTVFAGVSGYWNRQYSGAVNVKWFGAKGDGVTDDTVAIQKSVDNSTNVLLPSGAYRCNIEIKDSINFVGVAKETTLYAYNINLPVIQYKNIATLGWYNDIFENIRFASNSGLQTDIGFCFGDYVTKAETYAHAGRVIFRNCMFANLEKGVLKLNGNIGNKFYNCAFEHCNYGYYGLGNQVTNPTSTTVMHSGADYFYGCNFSESKKAGVAIYDATHGVGQWSFESCLFQSNYGFGLFFDFNIPSHLFSPIILLNTWLEANGGNNVTIDRLRSTPQVLMSSDYKLYGTTDLLVIGGEAYATRIGINIPTSPVTSLDVGGDMLLVGSNNGIYIGTPGSSAQIVNNTSEDLTVKPKGTNKSIIFGSGTKLAVGEDTPSTYGNRLMVNYAHGVPLLYSGSTATGLNSLVGLTVNAEGWNGAACGLFVGKYDSRSINCGGTVNASGADYAEYEYNNGLVIAKGDIVGFKADGTLTNKFSESIRFAVKSTDPSYVGGDTWGTEDKVGKPPLLPQRANELSDSEWDIILSNYNTAKIDFENKLEKARLMVDRIAYSGKVPVNVKGCVPGQYIIAVSSSDDNIVGLPIDKVNITFNQYQDAVGRVNRILDDGRAEVAVVIH